MKRKNRCSYNNCNNKFQTKIQTKVKACNTTSSNITIITLAASFFIILILFSTIFSIRNAHSEIIAMLDTKQFYLLEKAEQKADQRELRDLKKQEKEKEQNRVPASITVKDEATTWNKEDNSNSKEKAEYTKHDLNKKY
ncbi:MAG: hypothetical protein HQK51_09140 [Oligoflexia bacterium]|nr:hypothetical protein [Oligoflexia bacterium]